MSADVCATVATVAAVEAGTAVVRPACDGSQGQSSVFTGEGTISPAATPEMCFTVGEDIRSGRSDINQIKALSVAASAADRAADRAANQAWAVRPAD